MKDFLKKYWGNIVFAFVIALLLIPQTATPIKVFVQRVFSFSPSETKAENRTVLTAYHWPLQTLDLQKVNLKDSEGNVVLINFWATWCPPCIAEMPSLQKLYDRYGDKVDFYFVSSETPEKLQLFMQKRGYTFPVYIQQQQAPSLLETTTLPTTYVLSKTGAIVINETGAAQWDSESVQQTLDKLLKE